jgi:ankyrin repeat protein
LYIFNEDPFDFGLALTVAINQKQFECAYALLNTGANPNVRADFAFALNGSHTTALYQAVLQNNFSLTSALLKAEANMHMWKRESYDC